MCRSPRLVGSNLAICVELTLIDIALIRCKLLSVGYVLVHGTVRQCVVDDGIDSRKEVAALLKSDGRTLRVVRNIPCDFELRIVLDVLLCDGGLDEATFELTGNKLRNDIGYLCETDDVCIRRVLLARSIWMEPFCAPTGSLSNAA